MVRGRKNHPYRKDGSAAAGAMPANRLLKPRIFRWLPGRMLSRWGENGKKAAYLGLIIGQDKVLGYFGRDRFFANYGLHSLGTCGKDYVVSDS